MLKKAEMEREAAYTINLKSRQNMYPEGGKFSHLHVPLRVIDHKRAQSSLHKSFISGDLRQMGISAK